jgi:hypothetical protein
MGCVLRTASASIKRNSSFVIGGCRVVDDFHCAMSVYMGMPEQEINPRASGTLFLANLHERAPTSSPVGKRASVPTIEHMRWACRRLPPCGLRTDLLCKQAQTRRTTATNWHDGQIT